MKKVVVMLLIAVMIISMSACGPKTIQAQTESPSPSESAVSAEPSSNDSDGIVVGFLKKSLSNVFETKLNESVDAYMEQIKQEGTISDYVSLNADSDPSRQISQADDLVNMGVDVAILLPCEADGSAPALQTLVDAGIPTIVVNARTTNTDELAASYVGSYDVNAGEIMANYILDTIGETGGYCHLQGILGNSAAQQRGEGIHNIMDAQQGWKMLDEQSAEWAGDKASMFTQDWALLYGDELDVIICDNDEMSVASKIACIEAGREDIVVIGVDAIDSALAMVKDGELNGTVFQDAVGQGKTAAETAIKVALGQDVEKEIWIDFVLITAENIDDYYQGK